MLAGVTAPCSVPDSNPVHGPEGPLLNPGILRANWVTSQETVSRDERRAHGRDGVRDLSRRRERAVPAKVKEVLSYFLRNPNAADSLEGIARWRLMDERIHGCVAEFDQVLAWLVRHGFLVKESPLGSAPIFTLNAEKVAEAERLLTDLECVSARRSGKRGSSRS